MIRTCIKCGEIYPATTEYFYYSKHCKNGIRPRCKKCVNAEHRVYCKNNKEKIAAYRRQYQRRIYKNNPEKYRLKNHKNRNPVRVRNYDLLRRYGITQEQYTQILEQQNGVCAICEKPETAKNQYGLKRLAVDHNHKTNKIRGLLCNRCNTRLMIIEDGEYLKKAQNYLDINS